MKTRESLRWCTAYECYRVANALYRRRIPLIPKLIFYFMRFAFSTVLPPSATIGRNTLLNWNGLCVVVHARAVIGENCTIGHGVTIGGRSGYDRVPTIGNNVYVGVGAIILGPVTIGDNSIIGANAVVIHDVPANATAAGVPARIIKKTQPNTLVKGGDNLRLIEENNLFRIRSQEQKLKSDASGSHT